MWADELYTPPEYIDVKTTPDFVTASLNTLKHWLAIHTDARAWASNMMTDYNPLDYYHEFGGGIHHWFLSYTLEETIISVSVEEGFGDWFVCDECGMLFHRLDGKVCECESDEEIEAEKEDIMFFFEEVGVGPLTNQIVWEAMIGPMFDSYSENIDQLINGRLEDIRKAIEMLEGAKKPNEIIDALKFAHNVEHSNGFLLDDHGSEFGLEWELMDEGMIIWSLCCTEWEINQ